MTGFSIFIFIIFIIFGIGMTLIMNSTHENSIRSKIESFGGEVINIEKTMFDNGPFFIKGKGRTIYKFEYRIGKEIRTGWVKFGGLLGPDWKV